MVCLLENTSANALPLRAEYDRQIPRENSVVQLVERCVRRGRGRRNDPIALLLERGERTAQIGDSRDSQPFDRTRGRAADRGCQSWRPSLGQDQTMRPSRFSHPRERPDVLWILYTIQYDQPATCPGGRFSVVEQLGQGEFGQWPHAECDALVVPVGFRPLFEFRSIDDLDRHAGRSGEFDQFAPFCPLVPGPNPKPIQASSPGQKSFSDGMESRQPG